MNRYVLGFDIGVTSVGWGIIDENYEIVNAGVRLFEENDASKNKIRREKRGQRRVKRRRQQRILEMKRLLKKESIINDAFKPLPNPYALRVKGLNQKLNNDEIATALLHIVKRRGSTLDVDDFDADSKDEQKAKAALKQNSDILTSEDKHIAEIQLERLENNQQVRGNENIFKSEDYAKEAKAILYNQSVTDEFMQNAVELIKRKRHYSEGPGSFDSPTPYGRYRYDENGDIIKVNLIEEMRGKCSVYPNQLRAPSKAFSAELFNYLNDLNNLKLPDGNGKITTEQKQSILSEIREKGYLKPKNKPVEAVAKFLGYDPSTISGYRINSKNTPIMSEFKGYIAIKKVFDNFKETVPSDSVLDRISEILTANKLTDERINELKNLDLPKVVIDNLTRLNGFDSYHSLSLKAMYQINDEMMQTAENQMQIITKHKLNDNQNNQSLSLDENAILSPIAKRAHRETIKVYEALKQEYGEFTKIVFETTRAKNDKEEKDNIKKAQERNRQRKMKARQLVSDQLGEAYAERLSSTQILKLRLYNEQNGKCAYTFNPLDLRSIVENRDVYEIDHIIPFSISMDNSYNNKVLCENRANQLKGNLSPYHYFKSGKAYGNVTTFEAFYDLIKANENYSNKKKGYLLNQEDINKFDALEEFTERNLIDTSYAIRTLMTAFKKYFESNGIDTTVLTVKGQVTNMFRNRGANALYKDLPNLEENPLIKNRQYYHHHAIDALIAARLSEQRLIKKLMHLKYTERFDVETGEIVQGELNPLDDDKLIRFVKNLKNYNPDDFNFSWKIDTKANRSFSDETIYSTRKYDDDEFVIKKYKDIYALDNKKLKKVLEDHKEKLLTYKNDLQTFEKLYSIYQQYAHEKYPFAAYKDEHGWITKYSKKGKGPIIKQLKYADSKLGNYVDISHNYKPKDKKVILKQISPYRTDFYKTHDESVKFITLSYSELKKDEHNNSYIPKKLYENKLAEKNIDSNAQFLNSFHRNEIIEITSKDKSGTITKERWRFIATNHDKSNRIQVEPIKNVSDKDQIKLTIGRKTTHVTKYAVDVIGKTIKVNNETLKMRV